jgi:hemolysin activation/secretion protein
MPDPREDFANESNVSQPLEHRTRRIELRGRPAGPSWGLPSMSEATPRCPKDGIFPQITVIDRRHGLARRRWPLVLTLLPLSLPLFAWAQQHVVAPNPEQQGLPLNWRLEPLPQRAPQDTLAATGPAVADQTLPTPIRQIDCQAPRWCGEIHALLQPVIGQASVSGQALENARGQIWNLYRQHGSLTRIEIAAFARSAEEGGSVLRVRVQEIRVRAVRVQQEGSGEVSPAALDGILAGAKAELAEGGVFDLDRLDSRIRRRVFLGDVNLHAIVVPAGDDEIDVQLQVSAITAEPPEWIVQYDSYGTATYGRNRFTGGVALPTVVTPGDRLNVLATVSRGMDYGRVAYELPLVGWGTRAAAWASRVDYSAPSGEAGKVGQVGVDLTYPLYFGDTAVWTGYLDYVHSHQRDDVGNLTVADKRVDSVQARLDGNLLFGPAQSAHVSLALLRGQLDLSALPSALAQDRLSARSNGGFTKFNWDAAWNGLYGPGARFDARAEIKGQAADKNLDQSEKFALGGPSGVRAYGSSEALGDQGWLANLELGYRPLATLRLYGFYDVGYVHLYRESWVAGPTPPAYALRGAGIGAAYSYRALTGAVAYARQLGGNPGLAPDGLDAEGLRQRHRLWLTLSAQL